MASYSRKFFKTKKKNEGSIVFNPKGPLYPDKGNIFSEKIINIESRDIMYFPFFIVSLYYSL